MIRFERTTRAALVFLCGATLIAREARPAPPVSSSAVALSRFEEGKKAYDRGNFEEALLAFQASNSLMPSPNARLYIARCHRAMGKVASAYTSFRLASREAQDRLAATGEQRYSATRDTAAGEAAEIEAKVPRLTLVVPGDAPDRFTVKLDGVEVPRAAWGTALEIDPGEHVIEAGGPRLVPSSKKIALAEGAQIRLNVAAKRLPTAWISYRFAARPTGLAAALDGLPIDLAESTTGREVDAGQHELMVTAPGYARFRWTGSLVDGERVSVDIVLRPEARRIATPKWAFFTAAGGAVASIGVASGLAAHALAQQRGQLALDAYARDPGVRDAIRSEATTINVLFVTGGALAAGAGVLGFTTRWQDERAADPALAVTPWMAPGNGGVGVRGRF
jgi:tetratricopeptide (TPR) repeat protein